MAASFWGRTGQPRLRSGWRSEQSASGSSSLAIRQSRRANLLAANQEPQIDNGGRTRDRTLDLSRVSLPTSPAATYRKSFNHNYLRSVRFSTELCKPFKAISGLLQCRPKGIGTSTFSHRNYWILESRLYIRANYPNSTTIGCAFNVVNYGQSPNFTDCGAPL